MHKGIKKIKWLLGKKRKFRSIKLLNNYQVYLLKIQQKNYEIIKHYFEILI